MEKTHSNDPVQARFGSSMAGDLLEFTATYLAESANGAMNPWGFTIHVHGNSASSMKSFVQTHGDGAHGLHIEVESVMDEVPRFRVKPPSSAYEQTALGVYSRPGAADEVGKLKAGDEVLLGIGPRQGRWIKITYPVEGWVQSETRDGQAILHEILGMRPNLRQVVTLRSLSATALIGPRVECELPRDHEEAFFKSRANEASRLLREFALLESQGCKGGRPRQTVLGIF